MKIYLASNNAHKKQEMQAILKGYTLTTPSEEGLEFHPIERGESFIDNALIKARYLYNIVHSPVIADDSGLCCTALKGAPGIYSARYCGKDDIKGLYQRPPSAIKQCKLLLEHLGDSKDRRAYFTCALVLYLGEYRSYIIQESVEGVIVPSIDDMAGEGGFGYDPIFYLPEYKLTMAQLAEKPPSPSNGTIAKNAISHRGKATRALVKVMQSLVQERGSL